MPTSPYIEALKRTIEESDDLELQGVTRALLAACYARHGDFQLAEAEIASLRLAYGDGRSGRVSVMIMCAEAQVIYYKDLGEKARDRMMRAQVLSVAARDATLSALTSAWLAHICFNLHRHEEMARATKTALDTISAGDHEAASRLALTLGDAFFAAGEPESGNRWYAKAHERAVKLRDHSTIAALTYNRAAMGTFLARLRATGGQVDADLLSKVAGEVRTAVNYQAIAQLTSLQPLLDYSSASAALLTGDVHTASKLLTALIAQAPGTSPLDRSSALRCDLALCLARQGEVAAAKEQLNQVAREKVTALMPDDQVVALHALQEAANHCQMTELKAFATEALSAAKQEHAAVTSALLGNLKPFSDPSTLSRV